MTDQVTIAVALEGAGWHPAAWREPDARPHDLLRPAYWRDLLRTADDAGFVLATIEDRLELGDRDDPDAVATGRVRGRLDAVLVASYAAPLTRRIGLVPTVTATHPEPFHLATAIQTLDHTSLGRAGARVVAASSPAERANVGRRAVGPGGLPASGRVEDDPWLLDAFREAGDVVSAIRLLWDSWEDDAIVQDREAGRYIDRARIHGIRFAARSFSIEGASITPRSPQGQPIVAALAHQSVPYRFAAAHADVVFVTPADAAASGAVLAEVAAAEREVRGLPDRLRVVADLLVLVEDTPAAAAAALARLDQRGGSPLTSDARIVAGDPDTVVEEVRALAAAGFDGVRVRPARLPHDLVRLADDVLPRLASAGLLADTGDTTLRGRLGLARPDSRFTRDHQPYAAAQKGIA